MTFASPKHLWIVIAAAVALLAPGETRERKGSEPKLFRDGMVPVISLSIEGEAMSSLRVDARKFVPARVQVGEFAPCVARVRLKGHGSFQPIDEKPSFTIDLPHGLVPGVSRIHLNNSAEDPTFIQEKLGAEIFRAFGIIVPRVSHARVAVNGRDKGLYVLKEGFTRDFSNQNYPGADGAFSDATECSAFDLRTVDVEAFVNFIALEVLIGHWDGYSTSGHNARVFRGGNGKFRFLPSGMDQLFGNPKFPAIPDMTGALARAVMASDEGCVQYLEQLRELCGAFDGEFWASHATHLAEQLRPAVSLEEFLTIRENVGELRERIVARDRFLDHELKITTIALSVSAK